MCTYPTRSTLGRPRAHVQDRIDHLENLVLSLMRRQQQPAAVPDESSPQSDTALGTPSDRRDHVGTKVDAGVDADVDADVVDDFPVEVEFLNTSSPAKAQPHHAHDQRQVSPSPSDYGTIRMRKSGPSYANSTHWLAILDSITELREHVALENPSPEPVLQQNSPVTGFDLDTRPFPRPRLLYGCRVQASLSSILQAVPPRPVVDRLVSRYFNDLDMATGKPSVRKSVRSADIYPCQSFRRLADQRSPKALLIEASLYARYGSFSHSINEFHG